ETTFYFFKVINFAVKGDYGSFTLHGHVPVRRKVENFEAARAEAYFFIARNKDASVIRAAVHEGVAHFYKRAFIDFPRSIKVVYPSYAAHRNLSYDIFRPRYEQILRWNKISLDGS